MSFIDGFFSWLGTIGVIVSVLLFKSNGFMYVPMLPLIGFFCSSFLLCKICYGESLNADAKEAREFENFIKNHFRRVTYIEEQKKND